MKTKQISILTVLAIAFIFVFSSCEKNDIVTPQDSILPEKFSVAIPEAISIDGIGKKSFSQLDTLNGNSIYSHLRFFIHIGQNGADILEDIIHGLRLYHINRPLSLSYTSDEDGRIKNLEVLEEVYYEGVLWEYQLNISDAESEMNEDDGLGVQLFWSRNPGKGIAILKPFNIDKNSRPYFSNAMFQIEYSAAAENGYDEHMVVAVSGLPLASPLADPYSMSGMKMFAGKKGNIVDVYGNSDHPNAVFFSEQTGFSWSFVASGDNEKDLAVAEVGLPPSNLDEPSRSVLLDNYSIKNVFSNQIYNLWPFISQKTVDAYLHNTEAPGFFDKNGFIQGGDSPNADFDDLKIRLSSMSPYNPDEISDLELSFKLD